MTTLSPDLKLTFEDYLLFPDDGKRHELIDGEHYMTPAPNTRHQAISMNLASEIRWYLRDHPVGRVLAAPVDVVLSEVDVVQPDLVFVSEERSRIVTEANLQGAPDLVVEILSPSTRRTDEVVKRKLYERFGVGEYWVVDPELESIKVYRSGRSGFRRAAKLSAEDDHTLTTPRLPGLALPLASVFET